MKFFREANNWDPKYSISTNFGGKLSFILCFLFFLSAYTAAATYKFKVTICTTTIITLEPCALNA